MTNILTYNEKEYPVTDDQAYLVNKKGFFPKTCDLCSNLFLTKNTKNLYCETCVDKAPMVDRYKNRHSNLSDAEKKSILASNTKSVGPYFNPKEIK